MRDPAVEAFSPVIERSLALADGETARVLGVDPFLDRTSGPRSPRAVAGGGSRRDGTRPARLPAPADAVLVESGLAQRLGARSRRADRAPAEGALEVVGIFPNPAGEPLLLMDIAHAQALFGLAGRIDRVDLILNDPSGLSARDGRSDSAFGRARRQRETLGRMLRAFRLNLEALSLLALFVGVFLIYNTAMFAVVSRRKDAGILRSLGARRSEIVGRLPGRDPAPRARAAALGGLLGYGLSRILTAEIGGTVTNLYFFLRPAPPPWSLWIPVAGPGWAARPASSGASGRSASCSASIRSGPSAAGPRTGQATPAP